MPTEYCNPLWNDPSTNIPLPVAINEPFPNELMPAYEQILSTLRGNELIIKTDGACDPNPGYGGAGIYVKHPTDDILEIKIPIDDISNNYHSELIAVYHALTVIEEKFPNFSDPIIVLCDCQPVVTAIKGITKPKTYNNLITQCQMIIKTLETVPRIYWIPREFNTEADGLAKEAALLSKQYQLYGHEIPNTITLIANNNPYKDATDIEIEIRNQWSREWTNSEKTFCNQLILRPDKVYYKILLRLPPIERSMIARIWSGHIKLNNNMFNYQISPTYQCIH